MSDQGEQEDKTEEPTDKKLRDAAEQGDLPNSREVPLFAGLMAMLLVSTLMLRDAAARLADVLIHLIDDPGQWTLHNGGDATQIMMAVLQPAGSFLVPIFIVFIVAGLAASLAQNIPSVQLDRIMPKFSKISPAAGLKRLTGREGLVQFGKNAFKLIAIGFVVFLLIHSELQTVADTMFVQPITIPDRMLGVVTRMISGVAVGFVLLAGIDIVYSRVSWRKKMRMTKQEIKDEVRQSEGDPIFKAKRRSIALDRARRRMIAAVPRATMVIANPTHYAIALRYVREEGGAPIVVAKGLDLLALKIREIAEEHGISVIENKPLARSMYDHVKVDTAIPPKFYKAVAEIIHYIQSRSALRSSSKTSTVMR